MSLGNNLLGQQVDAQGELERNWSEVQAWLGGLLTERGVERISAEELTVPPGLDELFSLLQIRRHAESDDYDCVIVDCAPTGETLRLLAMPDLARWWLDRMVGRRALLDAARPFARAMLDVTLPGEGVMDEVGGLLRNLIALNEILRDHERVSVRLVMTPEQIVVDETRRTFTYLNLYGFLTDAVIVNRVFPEDVGEYFRAWRERQAEALESVRSGFSPVPVLPAPYFADEVRGAVMLDQLGEAVFAGIDPQAVLHDRVSERLELGVDAATLRLDLPFADKDDVQLNKVGLELIVRVDGHKRTLMLPPVMQELSSRRRRVCRRRPDRDLPAAHRLTDPTPEDETLRQLRERLRTTQEAVERLAAEAAEARAANGAAAARPRRGGHGLGGPGARQPRARRARARPGGAVAAAHRARAPAAAARAGDHRLVGRPACRTPADARSGAGRGEHPGRLGDDPPRTIRRMAETPQTWVLTGSPDNYAATKELGFTVIGLKQRNRNRAMQIEPGDRIVLYLTKIMSFAASIIVTGELYEDREKLWPGKPGKPDQYPWRFTTEPELVLPDDGFLPAEPLKGELDHIKKWPAEHWKLAFQGQIRPFSERDAELLRERMDRALAATTA